MHQGEKQKVSVRRFVSLIPSKKEQYICNDIDCEWIICNVLERTEDGRLTTRLLGKMLNKVLHQIVQKIYRLPKRMLFTFVYIDVCEEINTQNTVNHQFRRNVLVFEKG